MALTIGTDCSGIEAPIQALKQLKIPFIHKWSCEIDKHARESIKANYSPEVLYEDITEKRKLPNVDIYVCGFPCQTFSTAGKRKGMNDPRGTIFYHCLKAINQSQPKVFILENVKGLLSHDGGNTFRIIQNNLNKLKGYTVYHKVLNTRDYGIPQNRERVFIVGIRNQKGVFEWPKKKKMKDIESYIDYKIKGKNIEKITEIRSEFLKNKRTNFVDLQFIKWNSYNNNINFIPTITSHDMLWNINLKRLFTVKEKLQLQGFPKSFKQVVSDRQLSKQIGNSMSVNVLKALFLELFKVL